MPLVGPGGDLEAPRGAHVFDLQRRVVDSEALVEEALELEANAMAVRPRLDEHVRREGRKAVGNRPDVEIVGLDDARVAAIAGPTSAGGADAGAPSRKMRPDSPQERPGGSEHEPGDDQGRDRVEAIPAGCQNDERRKARAEEGSQVGDDVEVGAPDVEALSARAGEEPHHDEVHDDPGERDDADDSGVDLRRSMSLRIAS